MIKNIIKKTFLTILMFIFYILEEVVWGKIVIPLINKIKKYKIYQEIIFFCMV